MKHVASACRSVQWVMVLSTGRAGSTTLLAMLNAVPLIALSGEQHRSSQDAPANLPEDGLLGRLWQAYDLTARIDENPGYAFLSSPQYGGLQELMCSWLLYMLPPQPSEVVFRGFKELVHAVDVPRATALLPNVKVVRNYREDHEAQASSGFYEVQYGSQASGGVSSVAQWWFGPGAVADEQQLAIAEIEAREASLLNPLSYASDASTFDFPLERFSVAQFDKLLRFLGIEGCGYNRVAHANEGGSYTRADSNDGGNSTEPPLMWGECRLAHR